VYRVSAQGPRFTLHGADRAACPSERDKRLGGASGPVAPAAAGPARPFSPASDIPARTACWLTLATAPQRAAGNDPWAAERALRMIGVR